MGSADKLLPRPPGRARIDVQVECRRCKNEVDIANCDLENHIATCVKCSCVFDFTMPNPTLPRPRRRAPLAKPRSVTVEIDERAPIPAGYREADGVRQPRLRVRRRWLTLDAIVGVAAAAACAGMTGAFAHAGSRWITTGFALSAALAAYHTACLLVNRTVVNVEHGRLTVEHGPLPPLLRRAVAVAVADLQQLYCTADVARDSRGRVTRRYSLRATIKDEPELVLLSGLSDADVPIFLEQLLEDRLGIADVPVLGAIERPEDAALIE